MIDEVVGSMEPFEIEVKTAGVFPRWDKPRVVSIFSIESISPIT